MYDLVWKRINLVKRMWRILIHSLLVFIKNRMFLQSKNLFSLFIHTLIFLGGLVRKKLLFRKTKFVINDRNQQKPGIVETSKNKLGELGSMIGIKKNKDASKAEQPQ